jgi:hypothetical protein
MPDPAVRSGPSIRLLLAAAVPWDLTDHVDHDLIRRSHTQGILNPDKRSNDEWEASIYVFEGKPEGDRNSVTDTSMNMVLRPGEAITWRWGHASPVKYHGQKPKYPDTICNGLWEYRPDFTQAAWRQGATTVEGIKAGADGLSAAVGRTGTITWAMHSPYVFVGGKLAVEGNGAKFAISWDGKSWTDAGEDLAKFFPPNGPPRYEYKLRCEMGAGARLRRVAGFAGDGEHRRQHGRAADQGPDAAAALLRRQRHRGQLHRDRGALAR